MAEDIVERIILDDTDFIKGLDTISKKAAETSGKISTFTDATKESSKAVGTELVQSTEKAAKSVDNLTKVTYASAKAEQDRAKNITEVAMIMSKNERATEAVIKTYKALESVGDEAAKANTLAAEETMRAIIAMGDQAGLTREQMIVLYENIEEVGKATKEISGNNFAAFKVEFDKAADAADVFADEIKNLSDYDLKGATERLEQLALTSGTNTDEFKELAKEIGLYKARLTEADRAVEIYSKSTDALTGAIGQFEDRMYDLALAGKQNTQEFKDLQAEVIRMKTAIKDVDAQVDRFVDKKTGFATLASNVQLLGAGFQAVQAAQVLAGSESEAFEKSLLRLNSVMGITQAIEQARTVLIEQQRTGTGLFALATEGLTLKQTLYNVVVGTSTGVLKAFRIALAATGIGLIVLAIGALVANWDKLTKSIEESNGWIGKIGKAFKNLDSIFSGVINSIKSTFESFGNIFANVLQGNFSKALDGFKTLGRDAVQAFNDGFDENEIQKFRNKIADELDQTAKGLRKNAELIAAQGKDNFKATRESVEKELSALRLRNKDAEAISDKEHELRLLDAKRAKEINDKRIKAEEEYKKHMAEIKKQYIDAVKSIEDDLAKAGIITEKQYQDIINMRAIAMYEAQKATLEKIGKELKIDVTKEIQSLDKLIRNIEIPPIRIKPLELKKIEIKYDKKTIIPPQIKKDFQIEMELWLREIEQYGGFYNSIFAKIFGGGIKGKEISDAAMQFTSTFESLINESTNIQLNSIDKQLSRLSERRKELEDGLSKEQELFDKGLANNLENKQIEVDGLISEETRLQEEKERIQKEAQQRQLILDTLNQTQSLITTSAQILKGFSQIPLIGLPLGIAAVATMFGFFAKVKADAFKATRLSTGADRIDDFFGTVGHKSDIIGRGNGYKIIDSDTGHDTGVVISGREQLIPEFLTNKQAKFFKNLKGGMYDFDIADALDRKGGVMVQGSTVVNNFEMRNKQWVTYIDRKGNTKARLMDLPKDGTGSVVIFKD